MRNLQTEWQKYYNVSRSTDEAHGDVHDAHEHSELEEAAGPVTDVVFHSDHEEAHKGEGAVAAELAQQVKVLCWIMTGPKNHESKVIFYLVNSKNI